MDQSDGSHLPGESGIQGSENLGHESEVHQHGHIPEEGNEEMEVVELR